MRKDQRTGAEYCMENGQTGKDERHSEDSSRDRADETAGKTELTAGGKRESPEKIIAACGNDCSACPRYTAYSFEKTPEELRHTAELWMKIGYRDHIVSNEEISCAGCGPDNRCRYQVVGCCEEKGFKSCAECGFYPCGVMLDCFMVTKSFEPKCRQVCTGHEYGMLKKAFFEKEQNLKELRENGKTGDRLSDPGQTGHLCRKGR